MVIDGGGFGAFGLIAVVWFVLSIAFTVLLVALVILGIRWLLRSLNPPGPGAPSPSADDSALALLRERFARGEIEGDEFEQRRRTLGN
jgi:putative membrane protein